MVCDRGFVSVGAADASRRPAACSSQALPGRDCVGASIRCPMEGFTRNIPFVSDLLAKITNLVKVGCLPKSLAPLPVQIGWTRKTQLENGSGGRHVREG